MKTHPFKREMERISAYHTAQFLAGLIMRAIDQKLGVTRTKLKEFNRKQEITEARAIYTKLMHDCGFIHKASMHFIDRGKTAYYANLKTANNLLETNDPQFTTKYSSVKAYFKELRATEPEPKELKMTNSLLARV